MDKKITINAIASELGISHESVHSIFYDDLNMHCVCLHMVWKMLSLEQKEVRVNMFRYLIDMTDEENCDRHFLYHSQKKTSVK